MADFARCGCNTVYFLNDRSTCTCGRSFWTPGRLIGACPQCFCENQTKLEALAAARPEVPAPSGLVYAGNPEQDLLKMEFDRDEAARVDRERFRKEQLEKKGK